MGLFYMKKTLLAAALMAGFAGAAQAETSVTLYGIIDAGLGYHKASYKGYGSISRVGMIDGAQSGSRWGLRGSEDLGDGLRAVFRLESGFKSLNGNSGQDGRLFGRQATVGLAGDAWGTLEFGRQTTMTDKYLGDIDPFGNGFGQAAIDHTMSGTGRYDNLVLYRSPDFNGFQFGIGYSFSDNGDYHFRTSENIRALTAGLRYVNGPLNVSATYEQLRNIASWNTAADGAKPRTYAIGATYDFEVVKLAAAYTRTTDGWFGGKTMGVGLNKSPESYLDDQGAIVTDSLYGDRTFIDKDRVNSYMLGATVPIGGASKLMMSWQMASPNKHIKDRRYDETRVIALAEAEDALDSLADDLADKVIAGDLTVDEALAQYDAAENSIQGDRGRRAHTFSAAYTYDLSKRTNLYAYASHTRNFGFVKGLKSTGVGVGLRHQF